MGNPTLTSKAAQLLKILRQEARSGYADKTVFGGLDRFLANWVGSDGHFLPPLPSYSALTPEQRSLWAAELLQRRAKVSGAPSPAYLTSNNVPLPTPPKTALAAARKGKRTRKSPAPSLEKPAPVPSPKVARGRPRSPEVARGDSTGRATRRGESLAEGPAPQRHRPDILTLDSPLASVRGLRRDVTRRLATLGVETIRDALYFFPRRHLDFSLRQPIAQLTPGPEQTTAGFVWQAREITLGPRARGAEIILGDDTGNIRAVWFNQPYLVRLFRPQSQVILSGRVAVFRGHLVFEAPEYEFLDTEEADLTHTGRLVPVYPLTEGLSGRSVRRLLKEVLEAWAERVQDPLPQELRQRQGLLDVTEALRSAHYPASWESKEAARRRLAFDELLTIQLGALSKRREWQEGGGYSISPDQGTLQGFKASLPFRLTQAQERVLQEITTDLAQRQPMNRLLQGDVGSGKTVVAAAALLLTVAAGYQGAFMAPTEILAEQHYRNLSRLFGHPEFEAIETLQLSYFQRLNRPLRIGLLMGSLRSYEKQQLREGAASGELDILVGTHALIQQGVAFRRLALAVIDEQHRFGVAQRFALRQKGNNPHVLVMSATPIPRTLALTLYGDLESSVLEELPPGRQPIATSILGPEQRDRAYQFLRQQVTAGRQAFIICPLIEESPVVEAKAATAEHQRLSTEVFPDLRLGLLHGRMTPAEKDQAMERFRRGDLGILVSTSVVEVGIDVPNATVMLVESADRFGLSQLHQFRGRVGRGQHQSFCLLLAESPSAEATERLQVLISTTDGFQLAEEDLRLRGPGEFFGTRQTGLPELRMARLDDWELLEAARREAGALLNQDPALAAPQHQELKEALLRLRPSEESDRT